MNATTSNNPVQQGPSTAILPAPNVPSAFQDFQKIEEALNQLEATIQAAKQTTPTAIPPAWKAQAKYIRKMLEQIKAGIQTREQAELVGSQRVGSQREPLSFPPPWDGDKATFRAWRAAMSYIFKVDKEYLGSNEDQCAWLFVNLSPEAQKVAAPYYGNGGSEKHFNPEAFLDHLEWRYKISWYEEDMRWKRAQDIMEQRFQRARQFSQGGV
ncbi:hypothetical protein VTJ49DRAFT_6251 [Mycothermus thermophilus]|uniref:Gag protein n=1 Tax=Humicola insolens TaxID=85995 RepID=A0ABR3V2G6_HUMIN